MIDARLMHDESMAYIGKWGTASKLVTVVELGARHTWGVQIRDLFPGTQYWGVDAQEGNGVDEVADAATWQPAEPVDLVVCSEVFEHTPRWSQIVANAFRMLKPGGRAVFTCAGPGRAVHGLREDDPDERGYYRNVDSEDLQVAMVAAGFDDIEVSEVVHASTPLGGTDTQGTGIRP